VRCVNAGRCRAVTLLCWTGLYGAVTLLGWAGLDWTVWWLLCCAVCSVVWCVVWCVVRRSECLSHANPTTTMYVPAYLPTCL
jgi:hypothetical protein